MKIREYNTSLFRNPTEDGFVFTAIVSDPETKKAICSSIGVSNDKYEALQDALTGIDRAILSHIMLEDKINE